MNARQLKPADRDALLVPIRQHQAYLERLIARMDATGWESDAFRVATENALAATTAMREALDTTTAETLASLWMVLKDIGKLPGGAGDAEGVVSGARPQSADRPSR